MKFSQLLYGKDEDAFLFYSERQIQHTAKKLIGRRLKELELELLEINIATEIENLIIKIGNSTEGQIKDILNELKNNNREIELQNNLSSEGTFLIKWSYKDADGNLIFKYYPAPDGITEEEIKRIEEKGGEIFKII